MSEHPEFAAAAKGAKKQADRQGLVISWMKWQDGVMEWSGIPKRQAKAEAAQEPEYEPRGRGLSQGQLL